MEKLTVKNLGPIKDFTMETNRLTVLIGPQASGKSLLAQMLYFFRGAESLLAEQYNADSMKHYDLNDSILSVLDSIRATRFCDYCLDGTTIKYDDLSDIYRSGSMVVDVCEGGDDYCDWCDSEENADEDVEADEWVDETCDLECSGYLFDYLKECAHGWKLDKTNLSKSVKGGQLYIPTDRSFLSRLINTQPSVLYADHQPLIMKKFAEMIERAKRAYIYDSKFRSVEDQYLLPGVVPYSPALSASIVLNLQNNALAGTVDVSMELGGEWVWRVGEKKRISLTSLSSGQSESWPFFALASTYGISGKKYNFYFEEPETHLHPKAQVEVVKTIAYLISRGHRFVITTHSPFILYVINNLIQAHITYEGNPPEGEFSINPDHVAAYCLGRDDPNIVDKETKLLDLDEIDDVLDAIGKQFYSLLKQDFKKNG